MKDNEKSGKNIPLKIVIPVAAVVVLVLVNLFVGGYFGTGGARGTPEDYDPIIDTSAATGDGSQYEGNMAVAVPPENLPEPAKSVAFTTDAYRLTYSADFADYIKVREKQGSAGTDLEFYAVLSGGEELLYRLYFDSGEGDNDFTVGGTPFSFTATQPTEGLSAEDEFIFFAAQETINDVMQSLELL